MIIATAICEVFKKCALCEEFTVVTPLQFLQKTRSSLKQIVHANICRAEEMAQLGRALTTHEQLSSNSQSQCKKAGRVPVHLWPQCCGRGNRIRLAGCQLSSRLSERLTQWAKAENDSIGNQTSSLCVWYTHLCTAMQIHHTYRLQSNPLASWSLYRFLYISMYFF